MNEFLKYLEGKFGRNFEIFIANDLILELNEEE